MGPPIGPLGPNPGWIFAICLALLAASPKSTSSTGRAFLRLSSESSEYEDLFEEIDDIDLDLDLETDLDPDEVLDLDLDLEYDLDLLYDLDLDLDSLLIEERDLLRDLLDFDLFLEYEDRLEDFEEPDDFLLLFGDLDLDLEWSFLFLEDLLLVEETSERSEPSGDAGAWGRSAFSAAMSASVGGGGKGGRGGGEGKAGSVGGGGGPVGRGGGEAKDLRENEWRGLYKSSLL